MSSARKRKAREARKTSRVVDRAERIKPTPETVAKLKPHPLELLLARGREFGGIDADQLQCAEEIADAASAISRGRGMASSDPSSVNHGGRADAVMTVHEERLAAIWFAWAFDLARRQRVRPWVIVDLIASVEPLDARQVALLSGGLDLWAKVRRDMDRGGARL